VHTHKAGSAGRHGWVQRYAAPRPVERAGELGTFHLGSTVILLFEPKRVSLALEPGQSVRMGERIGVQVARRSEVAA
jgi:phosphatidylserine decarboxylase